jgi:hypothetical protein
LGIIANKERLTPPKRKVTLATTAKERGRIDMSESDLASYDQIASIVRVESTYHTPEMPFCFVNTNCPCHTNYEAIQKVAAWVSDGLMTEQEATNFILGRTF